MTTFLRACGLVLLMLAVGSTGSAGRADDEKKKADDEPKEESVVDYDSKTHGALQVKSVSEKPVDYFDVLKNGKRAFSGNPKLLNGTLKLEPGTYVVDVNKTQRTVTIEAGKKTILQTGELVVVGKPETAYWYPMQGKERRLVANPPILNRARALFAGTYTVFVHTSVTVDDTDLGKAEVKAGKKTELKH
jgi:hypothetical protein